MNLKKRDRQQKNLEMATLQKFKLLAMQCGHPAYLPQQNHHYHQLPLTLYSSAPKKDSKKRRMEWTHIQWNRSCLRHLHYKEIVDKMKEGISLKNNNNNNNKRTVRAKSEEFGSVGSNGVADGLIIGKLSAKLNTSSLRTFYDTSDTEKFPSIRYVSHTHRK